MCFLFPWQNAEYLVTNYKKIDCFEWFLCCLLDPQAVQFGDISQELLLSAKVRFMETCVTFLIHNALFSFFHLIKWKKKKKGRYVWHLPRSVGINNFLVALLVIGEWNTFKGYCFDIFPLTIKNTSKGPFTLPLEKFDTLLKLCKHQQDLTERKWQGTNEGFFNQLQEFSKKTDFCHPNLCPHGFVYYTPQPHFLQYCKFCCG